MKKILLSVALCSFTALSGIASTEWTLQGNVYSVDTLSHELVGPGTTLTKLALGGYHKERIFYTTTDLTNENVEIKAVKGKNTLTGLETVSSMSKSRSNSEYSYFSGVNADFFSMSAPTYSIGSVIVDGEVFIGKNNGWPGFGLDSKKKPYAGTIVFGGKVKSATAENAITGVNKGRGENDMIIYTPKMANTETNAYGTEVSLEPVEGAKIVPGKTAKMKVSCAPANAGSMVVPATGYVLSGHGTAAAFVAGLKEGDILDVELQVSFNGVNANITQSVGGQPMILSNNEVLNTDGVIDHLPTLQPRTAVGYSADGTKLVMMVVDGRSGISSGVTSKELAEIMRYVGCSEALNFDGGGSSAMYHSTFGVINRPSGNAERSVTDGLFVACKKAADNEIKSISFKDYSLFLPKYGFYKPVIYGYSATGELISTNVEGYKLSCSAELGEVKDNGLTLFCNGNGTHKLTATFNGATAELPVTVSEGVLSFRLQNVIEDSYKGYQVEVVSTISGENYSVDPTALTWSSDNESVAKVSASGLVTGVSNGVAKITGKLNEFTATLNVTVEVPTGHTVAIDPNTDMTTWKFSQSGCVVSAKNSLPAGMKLTLTGQKGRSPYLKIAKDVKVYSVPDSIQIRFSPNGMPLSSISVGVTNAKGDLKSYKQSLTNINTAKENVLKIAVSDIFETADRGLYPITFNYLNFGLKTMVTGKKYEFEIPGIEVIYKEVEQSGVENIVVEEDEIAVYPNPVKAGEPVTVSGVEGCEKVSVYTLSGELVAEVVGNESGFVTLSTASMSAGVYLIKYNNIIKKLIVK